MKVKRQRPRLSLNMEFHTKCFINGYQKIKSILNSHEKSIKTVRRVWNVWRSIHFQCFDIKLSDRVLDNNLKGLIVKDK